MKKLLCIFSISLISCGGASGSLNTTTKYLASNIIFNEAQADTSGAIDTETRILASNVVVDREELGLVSDNLQDALTEIVPSLETAIVGTWELTQVYSGGETVASENDIADYSVDFGTLTFNQDGTFESDLDSNLELSVFAYFEDQDVRYQNFVYQYRIISNQVISLKETADVIASPGSVIFNILPLQITNVQSNSISFNAAGTFYILTKQ